jgi:cytoskeletal protein RodZ
MANTFIFDDDNEPDTGGPQPDDSEAGNRSSFTIIAIIIGGVILVSLICIVAIAAFYLPQRQAAQLAANTSIAGTSTQNALVAQQTEEAALATPTLPPTPILTDTPSTTPVVVFATETPISEGTQDPATATVEALQTELASAQLTATFQPSATVGTLTPAALSNTGFADEVGLPGLFIVAVILLGVIMLARRLREVPTQ